MKRISYALAIMLIYFINVFGQTVSEPMHIYDNAGGQKTIYFGLDPLATDSIDEILGESDLPPFPPTGIFEARWILPEGGFNGTLSSYKDYRYAPYFPYTDTVEYRMKYQSAEGADTMFFSWNFPQEITALMQDIVTGTIVNVSMTGSGVFALTNFNALNQMRLTVYYSDVTPVELISFTASEMNGLVELKWQTASEINNNGFEVDRLSGSQSTWKKIGFVAGKGTTSEPQIYSFVDNNVSPGNYSYRLKQVDFNGEFKYSSEVDIDISGLLKYDLDQNYPNPFNPTTRIKYSVPADVYLTITIYNALGQKVSELINGFIKAGNHEINFDASQLSSGIYFYKLQTNGYTSTKKMILIR